ncbi:family 43 glycosylhydrolase [Mucilaginibacter ginsenosidivorax]|uniref:Family 43 glycosylhydrolase n=2 Tax=Mucilaginibacter ginsenosidivorax TaxID=862126 RepID=A0A5B8WA21_9SPHI|nr:family 43 glycosylhydrolase [Mucilaginibacter ginsenosidivorax]
MKIKTNSSFFTILFFAVFFLPTDTVYAQAKPDSLFFLESKWKDDQGNTINAHGAGILDYHNKYYLYGEIKKGKTTLVPGQNWLDYRVPAGGISCYSSSDLIHWKYEGVVLSPVTDDPQSNIDTSRVIERPKVIYNSKTKTFVMWMHLDKNDYSFAHVGVATSDKPTGPFTLKSSFLPNGNESRDMTLFKDSNERAYLIYSSENNSTMHVCQLSEDYLTTTKADKRIFVGLNREAPAMFKFRSQYYLITSGTTGWSPNQALCARTSNPLGKWSLIGNPCYGAKSETTYDSQGTFVLPLGKGKYLFMADRWNMTDLEKSGYVWLPMLVDGNSVKIKWKN